MKTPVNICKAIMGSVTNNGGKRAGVIDTLYQAGLRSYYNIAGTARHSCIQNSPLQ